MDRILAVLCTLFIHTTRFFRIAIVLKPSTILAFHATLLCDIRGAGSPKYVSSDHAALFRFQKCKANLRILDVADVKTVP